MAVDDTRTCDTCDTVIPRGTPYRSGWTTVDALVELLAGDPRTCPGYEREPDGRVRFDLCAGCVERSSGLARLTLPVSDPLA